MSDSTMDSTEMESHVIATYANHDQAEAAVRLLNQRGIDMRHLSLIGQNYHTEQQPLGFVNTGDRVLSWGKLGAFWGAIWGLLLGSAMLFVPGVGYVFFAGWIVSMLGGAVIGGAAGALGGALASIGVPNDTVVRYETALRAGSFLLIAHGTEEETQRARDILATTENTGIDTYQAVARPQATLR